MIGQLRADKLKLVLTGTLRNPKETHEIKGTVNDDVAAPDGQKWRTCYYPDIN